MDRHALAKPEIIKELDYESDKKYEFPRISQRFNAQYPKLVPARRPTLAEDGAALLEEQAVATGSRILRSLRALSRSRLTRSHQRSCI